MTGNSKITASSPDATTASFLKEVSGVIHIGANIGQERFLYDEHGLEVVWVEPIPEVFEVLTENLADFEKQRAYQSLITDKDDEEYDFYIANNFGASSSILDFNLHSEIWPNVEYVRSMTLKSQTLYSFIEKEGIDLDTYEALIMDTQGSELLVLQGTGNLLDSFNFIQTEAPDFESYTGCCQLKELEDYLSVYGFRERSRNRFARLEGDRGSYYDIVFEKEH